MSAKVKAMASPFRPTKASARNIRFLRDVSIDCFVTADYFVQTTRESTPMNGMQIEFG